MEFAHPSFVKCRSFLWAEMNVTYIQAQEQLGKDPKYATVNERGQNNFEQISKQPRSFVI